MDSSVQQQLRSNALIYKKSLDRIIDKYSKVQYQDAIEVDLNDTNLAALERYMKMSKKKMKLLESKSRSNSMEDMVEGASGSSWLELVQQDGGDETKILGQLCADDDMSSLDDTQRSLSQMDTQPEDRDEQLEMSLRSGGSTLSELYPAMIDKIGRAQQRQHVSEVADVVLKRYRKWRRMSNRSSFNNSLNVTDRYAATNHRLSPAKESTHTSINGRERTNRGSWWRSPMREPREKPVLVMDLSCLESPKRKRNLLNETFTVEEQPCAFSHSPSRFSDMTLRSKRLSLSASIPPKSNDVFGTPLRPSPLKMRLVSLSRSPQTPRSSKSSCVLASPRKPEMPASPLRKPLVPQRMLHPDSCLSSPKRRRHLSFDACLPSGQVPYSQKNLDEDFARHYHRFVCQNKTFLGSSCRLCASSSEATRQHSSQTLVALALSPQRLVLRKRHRDPVWENKSPANRWYPHSPGSKRHREMLRRRLCAPEAEPSNWSMLGTSSGWGEPSGLGSHWNANMAASYFDRKW